jgi:flagellar biogenesis protein FliO
LINYATKVPSKAQEIQKETARRITTAITAAFAFVIALAWKDAIRKAVDSIVLKMGVPETVYFYEFIVAIVVTLICVLGILMVSKYGVKKENK